MRPRVTIIRNTTRRVTRGALGPDTPLAADLEGDVARRAIAQVRECDDGDLAAALGPYFGDHGVHARYRRRVEHAGEVVDVARGRRQGIAPQLYSEEQQECVHG